MLRNCKSVTRANTNLIRSLWNIMHQDVNFLEEATCLTQSELINTVVH